MDSRQLHLMELARAGENRVEKVPEGEGWVSGEASIRSCGDEIAVYIQIDSGRVLDARYTGVGCALALASAEAVTSSLSGRQIKESVALLRNSRELLSGQEGKDSSASEAAAPLPQGFQELGLVREFPARKGCVLLAFDAALSALSKV